MISKECFVYLQLPDSHEVVTAGKLTWEKEGENTERGKFIYGRKYLSNSDMPLNPFELPLEEKEFIETKNEGIHGVIRDASPDSWGRYVIQKNTPLDDHNPIGYLLNSAEDRVGALSFGFGKEPPAPVRSYNQTVHLEKLIKAVHKFEENKPLDDTEKALLLAGAGSGGARPKATVEDGNSLWLAKFPSVTDKQNISRIEYATMMLAKNCGFDVPDMRIEKIGDNEVFLIKRFDREFDDKEQKYYRTHFASGLTLMNLDDRAYDLWSYLELADQMLRWVKKSDDNLNALYRRIVFNGLVSNTDDHPRNHGFLYNSKGYRLSPLYDVVPKPEVGSTRYLAMPFGDDGKIFTLKNLISKCDAFKLTKDDAESIYFDLKNKLVIGNPFSTITAYLNLILNMLKVHLTIGSF